MERPPAGGPGVPTTRRRRGSYPVGAVKPKRTRRRDRPSPPSTFRVAGRRSCRPGFEGSWPNGQSPDCYRGVWLTPQRPCRASAWTLDSRTITRRRSRACQHFYTSVNTLTSPPAEQRSHEARLLLTLTTLPSALKASSTPAIGTPVRAMRHAIHRRSFDSAAITSCIWLATGSGSVRRSRAGIKNLSGRSEGRSSGFASAALARAAESAPELTPPLIGARDQRVNLCSREQ